MWKELLVLADPFDPCGSHSFYIDQQKLKLKEAGKKLHTSDEQFFREAEKVIYDEFALVLNLRYDEVLPFIVKEISN